MKIFQNLVKIEDIRKLDKNFQVFEKNTSLDKFGQVLTTLDEFGQVTKVWTSLDNFGTILDEFGWVWSKLMIFQILAQFEDF